MDDEDFGNDTTGFSLGGLLNTATKLATTGAQVYGTIKSTTGGNPAPQKTAVETATAGSNKTLYIVGGIAVVILGAVLFFMRRGR